VLLATGVLTAWGIWAIKQTPLDALPDLSDVQVIIRTTWPGQAPQLIENQVTYPLTTTMLSVPGAKTVRGFSFFGDSFVYVIFEDGTDPYWARSRVLEYMSQVQSRLPAQAKPALGPDATGVGWIYQYALVDRTGHHDLAQLRALQDWFLKFELQALDGVAEVATIGGMVKQYQVVVDPLRLRGLRSRPFDGEGVRVGRTELVADGVLTSWMAEGASARQIGIEPTGHAARGVGGAPGASPSNFYLTAGQRSREQLLAAQPEAVLIVELIGQGINLVTGDYSRGAVGFMIRNGEIAEPVAEITVASNLADMFATLEPGSDLEFRRGMDAPTILIPEMTIGAA